MARLVQRVRTRVERALATKGLEYPWWVPLLSSTAQAGCVAVALWQREAFWPPRLLLLALLVVPTCAFCTFHTAVPPLAERFPFLVRRLWLIDGLPLVAAVLWLVLEPPTIAPALDFAPAALAILTLEITAREGPRPGLGFGIASIAVTVVGAAHGGLPGYAVNLIEIVFGFLVGLILYIQMRALRAERKARASEHERATQAERTRIAREIHDLVGHSLSVTLLHVTGARRLLAEDDDRAEALAALEDAEAVSRQAMTEIRRSVGALSRPSSDVAPLPSASEVVGLVEAVRRAGQPVALDRRGDLAALDQTLGLGVYRIVQESLSNVIRHAPGTTADVRVEVGRGRVVVDVRNPLPAHLAHQRHAAGRDQGTGIAGMTTRAEQLGGTLSAGPDGTGAGAGWRVLADLPLTTEPRDAECVAHRIVDALVDRAQEVAPSTPQP